MSDLDVPTSIGSLSLKDSTTPQPTVHPMDLPPHSRLFVKGSTTSMTEDFLRKVFSTYGEVDHIQVLYTKDTNEPKGSAFVKFKTAECAKAALKGACGTLDGHYQLEVTVAQPKGVRKVRQKQKTKELKATASNSEKLTATPSTSSELLRSASTNGKNMRVEEINNGDSTHDKNVKASADDDANTNTNTKTTAENNKEDPTNSITTSSSASSRRRRKRSRRSAGDAKSDNTITNPHSASGVPSATRRRVRRDTPSPQPKHFDRKRKRIERYLRS